MVHPCRQRVFYLVVISAATHSTQLRLRGTALYNRQESMALLLRLLELISQLSFTNNQRQKNSLNNEKM